jgi:hypothetical protein
MPKSTHEHQKEATATDRKFKPDDEKIYARERQEFQESETEKLAEEEKFKERTKAAGKKSKE